MLSPALTYRHGADSRVAGTLAEEAVIALPPHQPSQEEEWRHCLREPVLLFVS